MSAIGRGGFLWVAAGLTCLAVGMPWVFDADYRAMRSMASHAQHPVLGNHIRAAAPG